MLTISVRWLEGCRKDKK